MHQHKKRSRASPQGLKKEPETRSEVKPGVHLLVDIRRGGKEPAGCARDIWLPAVWSNLRDMQCPPSPSTEITQKKALQTR